MKNAIIAVKNSFNGKKMLVPETVDKIIDLYSMGWGKKKIARELGISPKTVRRYISKKEWQPYKTPIRQKKLEGLEKWLEETFLLHRGNAAVVHQELQRQHNISVNISTVERAVRAFRQKLISKSIATVRFETPPGKQMQIDFGTMTIKIAGQPQRVHFFAAILGYSRRQYVQAFLHERQTAWFEGMEGAFRYFDGIPSEVLMDNAKALVANHNPLTREVVFNNRLHAFANYWNFKPKACAPYRARTKGKDENTVKYLKRNAIAGREFASFQELEEHLAWWMREISDKRIHGTTGERPIERFQTREIKELRPLNGKSPFYQGRELRRIVQSDACVEVDCNFYSVPWQFIKKQVAVQVMDQEIKIFYENDEIASHPICLGRRERLVSLPHLAGVAGVHAIQEREKSEEKTKTLKIESYEFLRPLAEYEAVVGGWS